MERVVGAKAGKRCRGWWVWGGLTLLLPILAVAAGLSLFDPETLKPMLSAAVAHSTGRALHIGGPLRLAWSLSPSVEATDVSLANLPGGSRPDMARAERIVLSLSLPALLRRQVELTDLTLIGPDILFEQVDGQPNWRFDLPGPAGDVPAPGTAAPPAAPPAAPLELAIRRAHVQNGMITWRLPARTKVLGIRTLDVDHPEADGPIDARGTYVYGDNQPFDLDISGRPTAGLAGPWTTQLRFAAFDTAAAAHGTMDTAGHYDLQVDGQAGALEKLNALLPEMRLPAVRGANFAAHLGHGPRPGDLPVLGPATLRFGSAEGGPRLPGVSLGVSEIVVDGPGGRAAVRTVGRYAGQAFAVSGTVGVPPHPDEPGSLPLDLVVQATPGGTLGLKGRLGLRALAFDGLDAAVALDAPALAAWRPLLSPALPAMTGVRFEGRVVVPARMDTVSFGGARLGTDQGDLAGTGSFGPGGAVQARLRSGRLDGDAMLEAFGFHPAAPARRADGPAISDAPIPWAALHGLTLDLAAAVTTLELHGEAWKGVDLALRLRAGRLDGSARMAGQAASVSADAAGSGAVPVHLVVDAPNLPLALLAREAGLPGPVSGTARVEARLAGAGRSLHELAASLDGTASVVALDGRLTNAAFVRLVSASLEPLGIKVPAGGDTVLRCLGVGAAFKAGLGTLAPVALESTHLSLDGGGQVDLRRETVALRLNPLARVAGSPVSVPVVVEGRFGAMAGRLDASGLDKVGLLLDGLFGGDHSTACADAGLVPKR